MAEKVTSTESAMTLAALQAMTANCAGSFSVGGALVDDNGNVLNKMSNRVIQNGRTNDPTAHGERQLVDWYYANKDALGLPPPEQVTVVTSLDPCCMCAGAILTAGFKVAVGALDTYAGINYDKKFTFPSLRGSTRTQAINTFAYPEVEDGGCFNRARQGSLNIPPLPDGSKLDGKTVALCGSIFAATLSQIRDKINDDLPHDQLLDIGTLPPASPIIQELNTHYGQALQYRAAKAFVPDAGLAPFLKEGVAEDLKNGGTGHAVAMLDNRGYLLLCLPGAEGLSKIRRAFLEVTRSYAQLRSKLLSQNVPDVLKYLGHPKYCTFVMALGPDSESQGLLELGAYGSTMEGPLTQENPSPLQYVKPGMPQHDLDEFCTTLPPLYSQTIKVRPVQVTDQALIHSLG
ncbi:nucleoside deaminase [Paraburkholderia sp. UYCP14C]|uniref:nucleoside deaminase n=1 Tax=Paraburkholderia sp. UYCP14C TaxID=2511130 RepID=UPI00101F5D45|nr:nucleoside deaminase [Paraburkholderia sp. UYCP14C]RZF28995.1 nucleoside deaminase [Paraburkholderia sp. UYCP14C]